MSASDWLNRKQAAAFLTGEGYPIAPGTLARLAAKKTGPRYRLFMWRVSAYHKEALLKWARTQTIDK